MKPVIRTKCCGSSPLARGLPEPSGRGLPSARIIPARAGFTSGNRAARPGAWDHPRSRGVYPSVRPSVRPVLGSSPLARGLRVSRGEDDAHPWIIPARAGFTRQVDIGSRGHGDHPRSRGVYLPVGRGQHLGLGSSPLARGLLPNCHNGTYRHRIIPARAGFTRRR